MGGDVGHIYGDGAKYLIHIIKRCPIRAPLRKLEREGVCLS